MLSIFPSALAILFCGLVGAFAAWSIADALEWTGVGGAIATAIAGMVFATALWIVGVALRNALKRK